VEGCEAKLTMYPGAIEAFDRALAADPDFALAHAARAYALLERGHPAAARASMAAANSLAAGLSEREASHIAFFRLGFGGRRRSRTFLVVRASQRLATRHPGPRHHRVHQRADRQLRPRRAETRAAGRAGQACPELR